MKYLLTFLCLAMIAIIFYNCKRELKDKYYTITERVGEDQLPIFFLYTFNDSIFICNYYQYYNDLIVKYTVAYGKYVINKNSMIFFDSLTNRDFVFIKKNKDQYYCNSGFLKNYYMLSKQFVNNDDKNNHYLDMIDEINKIHDKTLDYNEISHWRKIESIFINKDTLIFTDKNHLLYIQLYPNGRFAISIENNVILRSGEYSIDKGVLTISDTIDDLTEKAIFVSDTILIPINLPFYWQVHEFKKVKSSDFVFTPTDFVP